MPNHFHSIISMDNPKRIPHVIRDFKRHTSQKISEYLLEFNEKFYVNWIQPFYGKKINNVWQEGYHPVLIKSEKWFYQKLNYIHDNPVRKGYVEKPDYWKYSSARNYILDDDSIIRLDIDKL